MEFFAHLNDLYQMGKKSGMVKKSRFRKIAKVQKPAGQKISKFTHPTESNNY